MMKPNILYIFTDQQSATMMSCAGNRNLKTPAMDSLARRGVRFERAYCSNPVCLPSRFSMITGRMPSYAGFRSNEWQAETDGIPDDLFRHGIGELFKDAGYDALYGGKVHLPGFNPDKLGFDILTYDERDGLAQAASSQILEHDQQRPWLMYLSLINPHDICFMAIEDDTKHQEFDLEDLKKKLNLTDEAIEVFSQGPRLKNTLLEDGEKLATDQLPALPPNHQPQQDEPEAIQTLLDQRPFRRNARENYDERRWRLHRWLYCRLTEIVDRQIQQILDAVEQSGQMDNTVIIFTSDHGDHDSSHKLEHKTALYEEACRIPLIVADPKCGCSGTVNTRHLVSNGLDLIPTLCDYAGIRHPDSSLTGSSIRPLVEGQLPPDWRENLLIESEFGTAIVTEQYKYVQYFEGQSRRQLYDLDLDPGETRNHLNDQMHAGVLPYFQKATDEIVKK